MLTHHGPIPLTGIMEATQLPQWPKPSTGPHRVPYTTLQADIASPCGYGAFNVMSAYCTAPRLCIDEVA
eukprot:8359053-Pyramimonas_sp.AAC.1